MPDSHRQRRRHRLCTASDVNALSLGAGRRYVIPAIPSPFPTSPQAIWELDVCGTEMPDGQHAIAC